MKNTQENLIQDAIENKENKKPGFEIIEGEENNISSELSIINDKIIHDEAIFGEDLSAIEDATKKLKVKIGAEILDVGEIEKNTGIERNIEIWEKIRNLKDGGKGDEIYHLIRRLTYIPESLAKFLSEVDWAKDKGVPIEIPMVRNITDKTLDYLSRCNVRYHFDLNGIEELSDDASNYISVNLAGKNVWICLDGIKTISLNTAKAFGDVCRKQDRKFGLKLNGCEFLSDEVIKHLSEVGNLELNSLTSLSDKGAEYFSEHDGLLRLKALKHLSNEAAEYLVKHRSNIFGGGFGVESISDEMARIFANSVPEDQIDKNDVVSGNHSLCLTSLTSLSDKSAEYFSQYKGYWLSLPELKNLSDSAIESLSNFKGRNLYLGITNLSENAAKSLSNFKGRELYLNSLTELSDKAAEHLSNLTQNNNGSTGHKLVLKNISNISDMALYYLKQYTGELHLNNTIKARMEKLK